MAKRRVRRAAQKPQEAAPPPPAWVYGGRYQPLSNAERDLVVQKAFDILATIGMANAPEDMRQRLCQAGAEMRHDGRILFPQALVERAIERAAHRVQLPGYVESRGCSIGGGRVHLGTGGAAVQVLEPESGEFRDSTLNDLYQMMRVLDTCDHIHYGVRPLVARDLPDPKSLDLNTAFACVKATGKPIGVSFDDPGHVADVTRLFDLALGREDGFRQQPFAMGIIVHVVPPLRYASEGVACMQAAIEAGMPLQICSAGQAGATSPASLAGALAQGLAESLAGLMVVDAIKPGHPCIFALMPFISDLRTGAMSGGGGESALANAAAAQLLLHLDLPSTVSAGMTDAKVADIQAGYEKGYTVALAAQAGADMINLSVGMLGSIMVASPETLVIDNDLCGAILRSVRGVDANDAMIDLETIERVVTGEGHYLGEAQTLALMKQEYVYPQLANRQSVAEWVGSGSTPLWQQACQTVRDILSQAEPEHLPQHAEQKIREQFDIHLA